MLPRTNVLPLVSGSDVFGMYMGVDTSVLVTYHMTNRSSIASGLELRLLTHCLGRGSNGGLAVMLTRFLQRAHRSKHCEGLLLSTSVVA